MGAEAFVAVGAWTCLGWLLDAQRALACAPSAVVRPWLFESGVESARFALLRFDRPVLDRPPIVEHLSRVLHGSVRAAPARAADPVCHAADCRHDRMFCSVSTGRLGVAMDARGTTDCVLWNRFLPGFVALSALFTLFSHQACASNLSPMRCRGSLGNSTILSSSTKGAVAIRPNDAGRA